MARLAKSSFDVCCPLSALITFIKPTVNEELEPIPDRAGKSPS